MTVPRRGSGGWSGIMERMPDPADRARGADRTEALVGAWVLVAGPDAATASRLRGRLADLGVAAVELAVDPEDAAARASAARPDAVLALPGFGEPLRARLDPLGLGGGPAPARAAARAPPGWGGPRRAGPAPLGRGGGPPVVAMDELPGLPAGAAGDDAVLDRLSLLLERHRLRARVRDLETVAATGVV